MDRDSGHGSKPDHRPVERGFPGYAVVDGTLTGWSVPILREGTQGKPEGMRGRSDTRSCSNER